MIVPPDAASPPDHGPVPAIEGALFLLPAAGCEIVDDWFVCGLSGTGSKDIVCAMRSYRRTWFCRFPKYGPARHRAAAITGTRSIECRC